MIPDGHPCPLDKSRLVYLAGSYGERGVDLTVCYCPRCDVAFVFLSPAGSASAPAALHWQRQGDQFVLREQDRGRWKKLPRQFRESWESNLRHHVKLFLDGRFSEAVGCPMDGGRIPVLHRSGEAAALPWLFAWCGYCGMGFLYVRDADYGWEHRADITWDAAKKKYLLRQLRETGGDHPVRPEIVRDFPSPPAPPG